MRSATFRNIALGILALAASYHLGARSAGAQAGSMVSGLTVHDRYDGGPGPGIYVLTPNGDLYFNALGQTGFSTQTRLVGNFWSLGGPIPAARETFGAIKSRYRGERGAAGSAP
jgi:hypothetical protein